MDQEGLLSDSVLEATRASAEFKLNFLFLFSKKHRWETAVWHITGAFCLPLLGRSKIESKLSGSQLV